MKVLVLGGCGTIGTQAVLDLAQTSGFDAIAIGEIDVSRAKRLASDISDRRVTVLKIDATHQQRLVESFDGFDVIANCLPFKYDLSVTKACIEAGVDGLDVSSDENQFDLHAKAQEADLTFVPGVGMTPGVTNVLARLGANLLDEVEEIDISFASFRCAAPSPGLWDTTLWEFDPDLEERAYFEDGRFVRVPPFWGERLVEFPEPIGANRVFVVPHPETYTLPRYIKGVRRVYIRGCWPRETMRLLRVLLDLGFFRSETVHIGGTEMTPRELISSYVLQSSEAKRTALWGYSVVVEVIGRRGGERIKHSFATSHPPMEEWGGEAAYAKNVGIPMSIGAQLIAQGHVQTRGVIPPEDAFQPSLFISELESRGIKVSGRTETLT